MKYDVHDGEIMIHQRDSDVFLPLSLAEMQNVVDVMNAVPEAVARQLVDAVMLMSVPADMMQRAEALLDNENEAE